jgi:predicted RNase H-like nuclease (RuvC/YqgF family)
MRMFSLLLLMLAGSVLAQDVVNSLPRTADNFGYLKPEDQRHFKNDVFEGRNQVERIDRNVAEINKLHGEVANLKSELANLKRELAELKQKR